MEPDTVEISVPVESKPLTEIPAEPKLLIQAPNSGPIADPVKPEMKPFEINVSIEELRKRKLFIATPMYGGMNAGMFCKSVADLVTVCHAHGIEARLYFLFNESLITRARNYCIDEFMRSGFSHLLFIDSDIGFNPHDMLGLLAMQGDDSPYDIIGAPYPKKCISWEKIKQAVDKGFADENPNVLENFIGDYVFNPKNNQGEIPIHQPVEVLEIGTGCMMVRRSVFEQFEKRFPEYMYKPDHIRTEHFDGSRKICQFFQAEIDTVNYAFEYREGIQKIREASEKNEIVTAVDAIKKINDLEAEIAKKAEAKSLRYLSEDYWFCQKVQELGLRTWLCPWMRLQHVGTYIFGGSLVDLAALGAPATADPMQLMKKKK